MAAVEKLDPEQTLERFQGRRVLELRPPGAVAKGEAFERLVTEYEPRSVFLLGDDVSDAMAFRVLRQMRSAGVTDGAAVAVQARAEVPAAVLASADIVLCLARGRDAVPLSTLSEARSMITIRPVDEADLETFFRHQSDPIASEMAVFGQRTHDDFIAHWRTILANPELFARAVLDDKALVGNVMSWSSDGMRYVGYWIDRDWWGRGVGTEALRQAVGEIKERPIWALVVVSNIGSQRVLEKNGFIRVKQQPSPEGGVEEYVYRLD
jgi:RimJ/RimL family protein N-acetyltransferase